MERECQQNDSLGRTANRRAHLLEWNEYYSGWDPDFTWWLKAPVQSVRGQACPPRNMRAFC